MDQNAGMKIKKTDQKIGKIPRETDRCPSVSVGSA